MKGFCGLVVYADDFVVCFQYKHEAEEFYARLKHRMGHFELELEESKSRLIKFNRRSHRESYTWKGLEDMLKVYPIAYGKVYISVYG